MSLFFEAITTAPTVTPTPEATPIPELAEVIDAVKEISPNKLVQLWDSYWPVCLAFLIKVVIALVVYAIGKRLIKFIIKVSKRGFERAKMELGVSNFICSMLRVLLYGLLLITIAQIVGIPTTSFVALLGTLGLTIGLALQGSLSNFAGGVLILILRPFGIGDYIIAQGNEGTVTAIDIFYTKILTVDNRVVVLPNGTLANSNITNVTGEKIRRLDLVIPIGYSDDIRSVKEELYKISQRNDKVLKEHNVDLFVTNYGDDAVEIAFRVWVNTDEYFLAKGELLETIKYMFDEKGFTIPFHQMDVTVVNKN